MKPKDPNAPYQLHGVNISYFTGKLEAYMRYKDIPFEIVNGCDLGKIFFHTGIKKMPAVETLQGQWPYDLFAMPKPLLKGTHIALSSPRGWRLGAQPRN